MYLFLVIGKQNCSRCEMIKNILNNKKITYTYVLYEDLSDNKKDIYMKKAREKGILSFPLIIKEDECVNINEVI